MPKRVVTKDDIRETAKRYGFDVKFQSRANLEETGGEVLIVTVSDKGEEQFSMIFNLLSQEDQTYALRDAVKMDRITNFLVDIKS